MTATDKESSRQSLKSTAKLGQILRKARHRRGHTLNDVAAALGRGISWVSDVEHGRRGSRMDPVIAMLWCDYLSIEPGPVLESIGIAGHSTDTTRVRHYLETSQWAHKYVKARARLKESLVLAERLAADCPLPGGLREDALALKNEISGVLQLLRVPRNVRESAKGHNDVER